MNIKLVSANAFILIWLAFASTHSYSATLSDEELKVFDSGDGLHVDPELVERYTQHVLDKHHVLAKYDKNLNGQIEGDELVKLNAYFANLATSPESVEIRDNAEDGGMVPLDPVPPPPVVFEDGSFNVAERQKVNRFYLRQSKIEFGIDSTEEGFATTEGASISWNNDIENDGEQKASIKAAFGYLWRINPGADGNEINILGSELTGLSFGPYVEANGQLFSDESSVEFGAIVQTELFEGPIFDLSRYSVTPYYQTDFNGEASVFGATGIWQPYKTEYGLGSIKGTKNRWIDYSFAFAGLADYRHVEDAGATNLRSGSNHLWLGVDATAKVWPFPDVFESRLFATVNGKIYRDLMNGHEATRFTAGVGWTLDDAGHATINFDYINGEEYQTQLTEELMLGTLKVRF